MKISVITVSFNAVSTIQRTLESVKNQVYSNIEHIVIDGKSTDGTQEIIQKFDHIKKIISEPDSGMYDALNKGLKLAVGDYIGILNADDALHDDEVINNLVKEIRTDQKNIYFADIRFVKKKKQDQTLRYYSSANWNPEKFRYGFMPAHPSCYIDHKLFEKFGNYRTDYQIAADYELLIRFLFTHKASYRYLPILMVDIVPGGRSNQNFKNRFILNQEIVRGCRENGIKTSMLKLGIKYFKKVFEYLPHPHER